MKMAEKITEKIGEETPRGYFVEVLEKPLTNLFENSGINPWKFS